MKKILSILFAALLLCGTGLSAQAQKVQKTLPFSKGINMPVWLESSRLNVLLYGKKDFENIKSMGVQAVRLPVWFEIWNEGAPEHKVSQECFEMLDKAIEWTGELGMFLILDFHNDCNGSSKTNPKIEQVLLKVWPQIAQRYKGKASHVVYEIMNEPHFATGNISGDIKKWGKIQGNVLKAIRAVDPSRLVVVGGGDWNSLASMLALPDYADENLIYNFHDYTPFLFTHQGAPWTDLKKVTGIPFPYSKEKMPKLPNGASESARNYYKNYQKDSVKENLCAPLDKAVEFANKRNCALMCNEFGVSMVYADPAERANWYRLKCAWMDERNICRTSWDYIQEFGVFKSTSETRFPEDLNKEVVEAMGFKVPAGKGESWYSQARKSGDWTIYKNGSAGLARVNAWSVDGSLASKEDDGQKCVLFKSLLPHGSLVFSFGEASDLGGLAAAGARLEFMIKSRDKALDLSVYFRDAQSKTFPWRAAKNIKAAEFKADGEWHKVSVPLQKMADIGGWSTKENAWKNSEGKFDWALVDALVFENGNSASANGFALKDIKLAP